MDELRNILERDADLYLRIVDGKAEINTAKLSDIIRSEGFSRRPELDEKSVYQEIVNQSRPPYEQWERILARRICAKFRAPDSSNEQAYEWGYADGKKSVGQPASSVNAEVVEALQELLDAYGHHTIKVDGSQYRATEGTKRPQLHQSGKGHQMLIKLKLPEKANPIEELHDLLNETSCLLCGENVSKVRRDTLDEILKLNEPLVRGMEIDSQELMRCIMDATDVPHANYLQMAEFVKANAHVWLKEVGG